MKKTIIGILILLFTSIGCEKDDICDPSTSTTPRLVIKFYDINNASVLKNVTNLKVIGDGMEKGIVFNTGSSDEGQYLANGNTISIPLKTNSETTKYRFILNSGNSNPNLIDTDELTFNYSKNDIYVSRACGFKTNFTFLINNPIIQVAVPQTKSKWIQSISIKKNTIENENETHLELYF